MQKLRVLKLLAFIHFLPALLYGQSSSGWGNSNRADVSSIFTIEEIKFAALLLFGLVLVLFLTFVIGALTTLMQKSRDGSTDQGTRRWPLPTDPVPRVARESGRKLPLVPRWKAAGKDADSEPPDRNSSEEDTRV